MIKTNIKKYDYFKTYLFQEAILKGKYKLPKLKPTQFIPNEVICFNEKQKLKTNDHRWLDFFMDDYNFDVIWTNCDRYIPILRKAKGVITPDFSMLPELLPGQNIFNCTRNRVIAYYLQKNNIDIIPVASWCYLEDFDWCLDGLPQYSSIAISTNGSLSNPYSKRILLKGVDILQKKLRPSHLIICGRELKELHKYNNIHYYDNFSIRLNKKLKNRK